MKPALRVFLAALSSAALLSACGKREADIAAEAEQALPKEEQMPTPAAAPGAEKTAASPDAPVPTPAAPEEAKTNADFEAWFAKYKLDLNDPKMLDSDADGDGFSNRDEFLADSNPLDPESRPGIHATMRLKEYTEVRLPFVLREVKADTATIEFDADGTGAREKVRKGDTIKGTKLKVDRVETRADIDKHGEKVDMSQLVLTDADTNERVVALKDLPTRTSASFATIVSADGKDALKVREGETFTWPAEPGSSYKVIDLRMDQVVVKDEASGRTLTIPRL